MTVSTTSNKISYAGTGATTTFPFSFAAESIVDIDVFVTDQFGIITQIAPAQFIVILNAPAGPNPTPVGGTVTYPIVGSPIPNGSTLTIVRTEDLTQPQSFANQGTLYQPTIEQALDRLTLMVQQFNEIASRSFVVSVSDPAPAPVPPVANRANQGAFFNSTGDLVPGALASAPVSVAMQPIVGASTVAQAQAMLGIPQTRTLESFGAVGNGSTDDTVAVKNAFATCAAAGFKLLGRSEATYKMTGNGMHMSFTGVNFDGNGCTFSFVGLTASDTGFFFLPVLGRTPTTLAAALGTANNAITVAATNGAIAGDLVAITCNDAATGNQYVHYSVVTGVAGTSVGLLDAIPPGFNFTFGVDTSVVQFLVASQGGVFRNVTIDGLGSTNNGVTGFGFNGNIGGLVENIKMTNWHGNGVASGTGGGGLSCDSCYGVTFSNLDFDQCGSLAAACYFRCGTSNFSNITARFNGFGPMWQFGSYNTVNNVQSSNSQGRAMKVNACLASNFSNITCTAATENGFTVSNGAAFNNINNLCTVGIAGVVGNQNQIWFSDQSNTFNKVTNFCAFRDTGIAGAHDIQIGPTDIFNVFMNGMTSNFTIADILDQSGATIYVNVNGVDAKASVGRTLVNGNNNDIGAPVLGDFQVVNGPTGAFTITGFSNDYDGRRFTIYNPTVQTMTIANDSGSSAVGNRIFTLTGADVVLAGPASANFIYHLAGSHWILTGTQG